MQNTKTIKTNRNHKSSTFTLLFKDKEKILELYNAIEGRNYGKDTEIQINTLENALYLDRINDLSFTIDGKQVVLIEHQSTINENMPLRALIYITQIYERIVDSSNIYRKSKVEIPRPEFIVLYNGEDPYPDEAILKLSDMYSNASDKIYMELDVKVYNVNKGHNLEILQKSRSLSDYVQFIDRIRLSMANGTSRDVSIETAINSCIKDGILVDFLKLHGSEVRNMLYVDFNMDDALAVRYEEGMEKGIEKGAELTKFDTAKKMLQKKMDISDIIEITGLTKEEIEKIKI